MIFWSEKCSPRSKIEPQIVVAADFDDLSDRFFVRSRRSFALLIESVHLHLLLCHNSHGHLTLQVSPCVPRDPDHARSLTAWTMAYLYRIYIIQYTVLLILYVITRGWEPEPQIRRAAGRPSHEATLNQFYSDANTTAEQDLSVVDGGTTSWCSPGARESVVSYHRCHNTHIRPEMGGIYT